MSTKANIAFEIRDINDEPTGTYSYSYCHFDGYPEALGRTLLEDYNDYKKAVELVNDGDMSYPGKPYMDGSLVRTTRDLRDLHSYSYTYIFIGKSWFVYLAKNDKLWDLDFYLNKLQSRNLDELI